MTVVYSRFHCVPVGDVSYKSHLIRNGQDMHVGCDVDVKHMEFVKFTQIIRDINKAC